MEFKELKNAILDKKLPPLTIMAGDIDIIQVYKEELYKKFNISKLNSVSDYIRLSQSRIQETDTVYLIEEDEIFKTNVNYWKYEFKNVVFIYTDLKKSDKLYKAFDKETVIFDKLTDRDFRGALRFLLDIDDEDMDWLIEHCNRSYPKIMSEASKIAIFPRSTHKATFQQFKRDNSFAVQELVDTYAFTNAIADRNTKEILAVIKNMETADILGNIAMAYNALKNQLLVKTHLTKSRDLQSKASELGMSKGQYYVLSQKRGYSVEELCRALYNLIETMDNIKTGKMSATDALNLYILTYITRR